MRWVNLALLQLQEHLKFFGQPVISYIINNSQASELERSINVAAYDRYNCRYDESV